MDGKRTVKSGDGQSDILYLNEIDGKIEPTI